MVWSCDASTDAGQEPMSQAREPRFGRLRLAVISQHLWRMTPEKCALVFSLGSL